jgi:hypothetical protein
MVFMTHPICRVLFIFTILSYFLIVVIVIRQQHTQFFPYAPVSSSITEQNTMRNEKYFAHIHQPFSSSILRGIIIFYPNDQEDDYLPELLWLYRSWIEMMKDESSLWKTYLIIYTGNYTSNLQQLACLYQRIRINRHERPQCRVFPYERILLRDAQYVHNIDHHVYQQFDRERSRLLTTHLRHHPYLDSVNIIAECYPSFSMYDYILRTDIDVFVTKYFARFVPYNDLLLVGQGDYATNFSTARLRRIAKDMNWLSANMTNIGSTWYVIILIHKVGNFFLLGIDHPI